MWSARNIFTANEACEFEELMCQGQLVEDTAKSDKPEDPGSDCQRWLLRTHRSHPVEDVIAMEQFKAVDLGVMSSQISEEPTHHGFVVTGT